MVIACAFVLIGCSAICCWLCGSCHIFWRYKDGKGKTCGTSWSSEYWLDGSDFPKAMHSLASRHSALFNQHWKDLAHMSPQILLNLVKKCGYSMPLVAKHFAPVTVVSVAVVNEETSLIVKTNE